MYRPLVVCLGFLLQSAPGLGQAAPADARAVLLAQQKELNGAPGVLILDRAAQLEGEITLSEGQALRIVAPLSVGRGTIHLTAGNDVRCEAPIHLANAGDLFVADGAHDISVRDCSVSVDGVPGGYLLTATRSERVTVANNQLLNLALFTTHNTGGPGSQTVSVSLTGNSTVFPNRNGPIGAYLMYVLRAAVSGNRFEGTGHGIEWWGGDGNVGWHGPAEVTQAGDMTITGNQCFAAGGACVWGSMGFNITVSGNSADICSDVCFDAEGGVRNLFTGNVAQACGSGCYSAQMEGEDVTFSGNFAYADAKAPALALILIKHRNGNPAPHQNLSVTGNTLSCGTLCTAFYSEGESGLDLSRNTFTNGVIRFANYTNSVRVVGNTLRFSVPLGAQPALLGPSLANAHFSTITDNLLLDEAGVPDPQAECIAQGWTDENNTDEMRITHNQCVGFGLGVVTETAGHNAGAPRAIWVVQDNSFARMPVGQDFVHHKISGNEVYLSDGGQH